jgi:hypothetical protein
MRLEQPVQTHDRLGLGERTMCLRRCSCILSEGELPPHSRKIGRFDPQRRKPTPDTGPDAVDPRPKLPSHSLGDRSIVEWISASPRSRSGCAIRGLCFDHDSERRRSDGCKALDQPACHRARNERCLLEILEWRREPLYNGQIDGEISRVRETISTRSKTMRLKSHGSKPGGNGTAGEASEFTERRDSEPSERRYHLLSIDRRDIERREKRRIVLNDVDRNITGCSGSGMLRRKWTVGESDPVPVSGYPIDLFHDPFDKQILAAVVADCSGHRDEDQPWFNNLDLWNESLDLGNDPFECDHLRRVVSFNRRDQWADPLRLTPSHPAADPGSVRNSIHRLDPPVGAYRLAGFILRHSGFPQRPLRIPHAERSSHRPPSRSSGSSPSLLFQKR